MVTEADIFRIQSIAGGPSKVEKHSSDIKGDILRIGAGLTFQAAQEGIRNYETNYKNQYQEIIDLNLGTDETVKRLSALDAQYKYASFFSPAVSRQQAKTKSIQENLPLMKQAMTDRLLEKNMADDLMSFINHAETYEQYENFAKNLDKSLDETLKTSKSMEYTARFDAYKEYAKFSIPHRQSLKIGASSDNAIIKQYRNKASNLFINKFQAEGKASPTAQDLDHFVDSMRSSLGPWGDNSEIWIAQDVYSLLKQYADGNTIDHALNKYPHMFSTEQHTELVKGIASKMDLLSTNPMPATEIDKEIASRNMLGIYVPLQESLISNADIRSFNSFIHGKNLNFFSPEKIDQAMLTEAGWGDHASKIIEIKNKFIQDFEDDFYNALIARNVVNPEKINELPTLIIDPETKTIANKGSFDTALEIRIRDVLSFKNFYGDTAAINNIWSAKEKENLRQVFSQLTPQEQWNLALGIYSMIDSANHGQGAQTMSIYDHKTGYYNNQIDPVNNISKFTDNRELINLILNAKSMPTSVPIAYRAMNVPEAKKNLEMLREGSRRSQTTTFGIEWFNFDDITQNAIVDYVTGVGLSKGNYSLDRETGLMKIVGQPIVQQQHAAVPQHMQKELRDSISRKRLIINGKETNLSNLIWKELATIRNIPGHLNKYHILVATDIKSAKSGQYVIYKDPKTGKTDTIEIVESNYK